MIGAGERASCELDGPSLQWDDTAAVPHLDDHYYFVHVVDKGGFSAASRALGLPKSTLSRRIIGLELRLGVRLIQRTSRSFLLTDAGREFYQHARAVLSEAEAAEDAIRRRLAEPSGTVRFTCSIGMAHGLAELLATFMARFPKVNLVQYATNRYVNLVDEGFDLGLRGHFEPLPDSGLVQRLLAPTPWHLFAATAYIDHAGTPASPMDLTGHSVVSLGVSKDETFCKLRRADGEQAVIPLVPRMRSNNLEVLKLAAIAGVGIAALPAYLGRMETKQARLVRVLPEWVTQADAAITLLTPSRCGLQPSVRAFIDFLVAEFPRLVSGNPH